MNRLLLVLAGVLVAFGLFFQWKIAQDFQRHEEARQRYQQALVEYRARNLYYTPWRTVQWIANRQNPAGYFVSNPDMLFEPTQLNESTLRLTRYAVTTLADLGGLDKINRQAVQRFVMGLYGTHPSDARLPSGDYAGFAVMAGHPVGVRPTMDALMILDTLGVLEDAGIDLERVWNYILAHQNPDGGFWDEHYARHGQRSTLKCTSFAARALAILQRYLDRPVPEATRQGIARFVRASFDPARGSYAARPEESARDVYNAFRAFVSIFDTAPGELAARRKAVTEVIPLARLFQHVQDEHYLQGEGAYARYPTREDQKPSLKATHLIVWMLHDMDRLDWLPRQEIVRFVVFLEAANGQYGGDIYTTYSAIGILQKLGVATTPLIPPEEPVMREAVPSYVPVVFLLAALATLALGHQVKRAELQHINRALAEQANMDGLTGIYNRQKFEADLKRELELYRRHGRPLTIIMFDVDNFKAINDRHGHLAGDRVLCEVAELVSSSLRAVDLFARWGGEEFGILLPETDQRGGCQLAEKLRRLFECYPFSIGQQVTASFGVAQALPDDDEATLTDRADRAMLKAKELGRNRVELAVEGIARSLRGSA